MRQRVVSLFGFLVLVVFAMVGCFGDRSDAPLTIPVSGRVCFRGEPLTKGAIYFEPVQPAEGFPTRPASGSIDSNGRYEMSTFSRGDGVIPGEYRVRIISFVNEPTVEMAPKDIIWAIPPKYGDGQKSGLEIQVVAGDSKEIVRDFDLNE